MLYIDGVRKAPYIIEGALLSWGWVGFLDSVRAGWSPGGGWEDKRVFRGFAAPPGPSFNALFLIFQRGGETEAFNAFHRPGAYHSIRGEKALPKDATKGEP